MNNKKKVLTMAFLILFSIGSIAQTLQLKLSNATVKKAMTALKQKSGYSFVYEANDINTDKIVNVDAKTLNQAVTQILSGQDVSYEIKGKSIVIKKNSYQQTKGNSEKQKVVGKITDNNGEAIVGATILEKGTKNGTVSDLDGNFSFDVSHNATLVISYIGYVTKTVKATPGKSITIAISEDQNSLEEVVVVGYGTMKKRDLTGAVTSVKMDDEPVGTVSTISHALAGKAAGLQVSTVSAQPGGGAMFRIRGAASVNGGNDPLVIIDGFPVNSTWDVSVGNYDSGSSDNILSSINPNDIESIEVLKDASATAIYGARAGH